MNTLARAHQRASTWLHDGRPESERTVIWGHHDAPQPHDGTMAGLLSDWRAVDPEVRTAWPSSCHGASIQQLDGFTDGSVRLILKSVDDDWADGGPEDACAGGDDARLPSDETQPAERTFTAYGHLVDGWPEDGGEDVVFQLARLDWGAHQFTVTGAHHAAPQWHDGSEAAWHLSAIASTMACLETTYMTSV